MVVSNALLCRKGSMAGEMVRLNYGVSPVLMSLYDGIRYFSVLDEVYGQ